MSPADHPHGSNLRAGGSSPNPTPPQADVPPPLGWQGLYAIVIAWLVITIALLAVLTLSFR